MWCMNKIIIFLKKFEDHQCACILFFDIKWINFASNTLFLWLKQIKTNTKWYLYPTNINKSATNEILKDQCGFPEKKNCINSQAITDKYGCKGAFYIYTTI